MQIFSDPLSQKIVQALCWMLIHSLWLGVLLAVFAAVILVTTRKSKPSVRYNWFAGLLLAFTLSAGFLFYAELADRLETLPDSQAAGNRSTDAVALVSNTSLQTFTDLQTLATQQGAERWFSQIAAFLNDHAVGIVALWLLIFLFKSFRTTMGLLHLRRLRAAETEGVSEAWNWRLRQLAQKLNMYKRIGLIESVYTQVPMVVGFLKPVVIVPVGFLTSLPIQQVEAILLHELAHIRRGDYLVNLLQIFAETIFFFNPAVFWVSALIREEREHCCDDLAIAVLQNKSFLVNALVSFQSHNLADKQAVAFAGRRNQLLDRIKRIIYNNNKQLDAMEKVFVTASVLAAALLSAAFTLGQAKMPMPEPPAPIEVPAPPAPPAPVEPAGIASLPALPEPIAPPTPPMPLIDTIPGFRTYEDMQNDGMHSYHFERDGKDYRGIEDNGELVYLKVDGKAIAKADMPAYEATLKTVRDEMKVARAKAEVARQEAEGHRLQAHQMRLQAEEVRRQSEVHRLQANEARKHAEQFRVQADELRIQADVMRKGAEKMRLEAGLSREAAEKLRVQAEDMRKHAEKARQQADVMREKFEKLQAAMIDQMLDEKLIDEREGLSYKINGSELIINGKKQPDVVHKRFKDKYLESDDAQMMYNWSGDGGVRTGILKEKK